MHPADTSDHHLESPNPQSSRSESFNPESFNPESFNPESFNPESSNPESSNPGSKPTAPDSADRETDRETDRKADRETDRTTAHAPNVEITDDNVPTPRASAGRTTSQTTTRPETPAPSDAAPPRSSSTDNDTPPEPTCTTTPDQQSRDRHADGTEATSPAAAPATRPSEVLDLRNWYLTLPTGDEGDPDTVHQPDLATFSSRYFALNDTGDGVVFTAPVDGVTTKNSRYPRSELREMNGPEEAAWSNTSGVHTLTVSQAVTHLPDAKPEAVAAQIHDGNDDVLQIRLEGTRLLAQYDDGAQQVELDPNYTLGTRYTLTITAADQRVASLPDSGYRTQ
jgi:Alginate lyase